MINQILFCFLSLNAFILYINAQQNYSGNSALDCNNKDKSGPSSAFLYTCNGQNRYCKAYLIYKSQPPFDTIPAISALTSSNQAELARINDVTEDSKFPTGKERKINGVCQSGNTERSKKNFVQPEDLRVEIASFEQGLRLFTFKEIQKATENFSSRNRINGSVYRGGFGRGKILAVKRMKLDVSKEVKLLKNINHFNLIKLQGVCQNDGTFFLLFEYMKKGSLRDWLNSQSPDEIGSWTRRIQIALDIANGLHYLHSFTKPAYVHGDIKSTNVLLNSILRAKIANFSLARAVVNETSSISLTNHVVGTRGYVAPEYIQTGQITSKIDVYAFGVVLSELVTGKDAIIVQDGREVMLSAAVVSIMETEYAESELISFIDQRLICDDRTQLALRMAQLSVACLTEEPTKRPSMEEVVSALLKIRADAFN
ncbi:hypothetical protein COLO4_26384 [Corchorus olitorius]|uniref:Protein kinase domain-containing protein n=1 Tax=Corchorus olitorius TaxID=93759 RepID=A0A1R3HXG6_9ROSI|nr:hypothetical protein COLO4_26384 [Corchorus olitorius]